jgi:hypothetical protein
MMAILPYIGCQNCKMETRRPHSVITVAHDGRPLQETVASPTATTGNAAFAVPLNFWRASFIGRTAKSFFAVRHTKRMVTNLCRVFYFTAHGKESLPCVLNTDARQIFFFLHSLQQTVVSL